MPFRVIPDVVRRALTAELPDDDTGERILATAVSHAEDHGFRRFTIDDLARRLGISRVTIYKHFPKKDQLLDAVLMRELRRFLHQVDQVVNAQPTPEDKLIEGVAFALQFLRGHGLLTRLLRTEPELVLPHLTADTVITAASTWVAEHIQREVDAGKLELPDAHIHYGAELISRIVVSLTISPNTGFPIDDSTDFRTTAHTYLDPLVHSLLSPPPRP